MIIKACIFDLSGTIIDRYSITPLLSLQKAFIKRGVKVDGNIIRKDMGIAKREHIHKLLNNKTIQNDWLKNNKLNGITKEELYKDFKKIQKIETIERMKQIPEVLNCYRYLRDNNISIGVTTGFDKKQTELVKSLLETNNIYLDSYVSSTCLKSQKGRPEPFMIFKNMENLDINYSRQIIKIDDTVSGIKEGLNADCITVGVARWSTYMNINSRKEMLELDNTIINNYHVYVKNRELLEKKLRYSKEVLKESGAHYVIETLDELPKIVEHINNLKKPNPYSKISS